ncbi:MAG TPA: DgsA anti-repressor MtfA, partial [Cytophagales bacterium]|nr:DgsA anti-repressor MtfA [Cytophagales bacterium]
KLCQIIYSKIFIPRDFDEVTDEMKVLISATAVQLTFGLDGVYLSHFRKILIYPNDYYSSITKKFHKGEVNPAFGIIVLSWHSYVMGYLNSNQDGVNLGLHEMAHALRLENIIRNSEYQFFNEVLLNRLDEYGMAVCEPADYEQVKFFRPYACANTHEFFAVAVENFFERPMQLQLAMPGLYAVLCALLNQDPANYSSATSKDSAA